MSSQAQIANAKWQEQRATLEAFTRNNKNKDLLAKYLNELINKEKAPSHVSADKPFPGAQNPSHIDVKGFEHAGLHEQDIRLLASCLPGDWLGGITYHSGHAPHPAAHHLGNCSLVIIEPGESQKISLKIYDPLQDPEAWSDTLTSGILHAFAQRAVLDYLPKNSTIILDNISSGKKQVFRPAYVDSIHRPGRTTHESKEQNRRSLMAEVIKTAYEAPFKGPKEDWREALTRALMGMHHLNQKQAQELSGLLADYVAAHYPDTDMNQLIRAFQDQIKKIEFKAIANRAASLFEGIHDPGLNSFIKHWLKSIDHQSVQILPEKVIIPHHDKTKTLRLNFAMDGARDLTSSLTSSLRAGAAAKSEKKQALNELRLNIRRFNEIWKDLDKHEQKMLRPRVLQIIHAMALTQAL